MPTDSNKLILKNHSWLLDRQEDTSPSLVVELAKWQQATSFWCPASSTPFQASAKSQRPTQATLRVLHRLADMIHVSLQGSILSATKEYEMTATHIVRRRLLTVAGAVLALGSTGRLLQAQEWAPTDTMRGGANNYLPGAPIVDRIGGGGFWMSGTVRRAGDGAPLAGQRIQIWAHTTEGREHEPHSHGATLTDEKGNYRLEMPQIVPTFGQPHAHLAYDSEGYEAVFLRPILSDRSATSLEAHFVLQPI